MKAVSFIKACRRRLLIGLCGLLLFVPSSAWAALPQVYDTAPSSTPPMSSSSSSSSANSTECEPQDVRKSGSMASFAGAWQAEVVQRLLDAQQYPPQALSEGIEGTVYLKIQAERSGQVSQISIARSSGSVILDQAALRTAQQAQPLPQFPCDAPDKAIFIQPLKYRIEP